MVVRFDQNGVGELDEWSVEQPGTAFLAKCDSSGLAEVEVKCGSCSSLYVLPCESKLCATPAPIAAPVPPTPDIGCTYSASLMSVVGKNGEPLAYPDGAVWVDDSGELNYGEIGFSVKQLWKGGQISWVSVIVDTDGDDALDSCQKENGFDPNEVNSYTTMCDPSVGSITIQLNLHDGQFKTSNNKNPGLCDGWPDNGKNSNVASYDVTFSCTCDRRLESDEGDVVAEEPSSDPDDMPYCVSEDFPCEGDEANMVYVCHYSSRKGYQTFCVPEADSDILRFYSHDYCGPCEGGQGVTWGKMTN